MGALSKNNSLEPKMSSKDWLRLRYSPVLLYIYMHAKRQYMFCFTEHISHIDVLQFSCSFDSRCKAGRFAESGAHNRPLWFLRARRNKFPRSRPSLSELKPGLIPSRLLAASAGDMASHNDPPRLLQGFTLLITNTSAEDGLRMQRGLPAVNKHAKLWVQTVCKTQKQATRRQVESHKWSSDAQHHIISSIERLALSLHNGPLDIIWLILHLY